MTEHTILFSTDISQQAANNFINVLAHLAQQQPQTTRLILGINSNGGNVVAGVLLHNALLAMPFEVVTHNLSNVDSIANVIFMGGAVRKANPGSTFMFHGVGFDGNANERLDEKLLLEKLDVITSDQKRLSQIISGRSGGLLTVKSCMALFKQQGTRGAEWAHGKGIVHSIEPFVYPANNQFYTFFG